MKDLRLNKKLNQPYLTNKINTYLLLVSATFHWLIWLVGIVFVSGHITYSFVLQLYYLLLLIWKIDITSNFQGRNRILELNIPMLNWQEAWATFRSLINNNMITFNTYYKTTPLAALLTIVLYTELHIQSRLMHLKINAESDCHPSRSQTRESFLLLEWIVILALKCQSVESILLAKVCEFCNTLVYLIWN